MLINLTKIDVNNILTALSLYIDDYQIDDINIINTHNKFIEIKSDIDKDKMNWNKE